MKDKKQIERYKKAIDNEDWHTIEKIQKETKKNTYRLEKNQTSLGNVQVGVERG